jgi:hypothetical protein
VSTLTANVTIAGLLARSKGGLFAWDSVSRFSTVILVEGLFDLAVLWQAGFRNTTCAIGTHFTPAQWAQLSRQPGPRVYIAFDEDANHAGQRASRHIACRLQKAGLHAISFGLPAGQDPNSYFAAGATAADFLTCLKKGHVVMSISFIQGVHRLRPSVRRHGSDGHPLPRLSFHIPNSVPPRPVPPLP